MKFKKGDTIKKVKYNIIFKVLEAPSDKDYYILKYGKYEFWAKKDEINEVCILVDNNEPAEKS